MNNGQVKQVEITAAFPSESGHWYSPETGQQVELPKGTWSKTAIKRGLVPGVTSITKLVARDALTRWKINRAIVITKDIVCELPDEEGLISDEWLLECAWERLDAESEATTGRGKELHAAIEQAAQGLIPDAKWQKHCANVFKELQDMGIALTRGSTEHSFATERYGGKVDWHNDEWLLDFKTKDSIKEGKKLAYPEHAMQLAAYLNGIGIENPRSANVFIGVDDAKVHVHEWDWFQLERGWRKFECLLDFWWEDKQP